MLDTAIILAGGAGERLRPLTDSTPKPLLPMKGKPILAHSIKQLQKNGVKRIVLSVGYKAQQIEGYFGNGERFGVTLAYVVEDAPLGTGGAVQKAAAGIAEPFFLLWGDNLMDIDYRAMYKAYLRDAPQVTMALTPREDVEHFGVASLQGNRITSFIEKPSRQHAPSNLINAGAFVIDPNCLKILPRGKSSIERDCFEKLAPLGEISPYVHQGQWFPTDTLEKYAEACCGFRPEIERGRKRIIIADVDDTICESASLISERMAKQINSMIQKGYCFAFISGTSTADLLSMISSSLVEEHHLLANTGTKYSKVNGAAKTLCYNHSLTPEEHGEIVRAIEKLIDQYTIQTMTTREDQIQNRDSQITLSAIGRHAALEQKRKYDPQGNKRKMFVEFLRQHLHESNYEITIGGTTSIDITRRGLDKEWAIREFLMFNSFSAEEVVFLGDKIYPGGNDYPASRIVDCIAVRNPDDTLQELKRLEDSR